MTARYLQCDAVRSIGICMRDRRPALLRQDPRRPLDHREFRPGSGRLKRGWPSSRASNDGRRLKLSVLHGQQCEGRVETRERRYSLGPGGHVGPALQIERANLRKGNVAIAEQIRDGGFGSTEIGAISKVRVQYRQRRLGTPAMVVGNRRLDADWKKFS